MDRENNGRALPEAEGILEVGVDELNLAEFSLASVSDRFLDGKKTVIFHDEILDRVENKLVPRQLTISGSDRFGLPTAKDDDVLLACVQISWLGGFQSREVKFSRYEILKLLGWSDSSRNYARVSEALRRWKGVSIYSDRAFYDHGEKSWVNRDFGIFDTLNIYQRESSRGKNAPACSSFTWNEVIFNSFKSGYLKQLDWKLYRQLQSQVAKRLYRFLDKRFYHRNTVEIDLKELAVSKVRLSENQNAAQMKRTIDRGIAELETVWELKHLPTKKRYAKISKGRWSVRFERRPKPKTLGVKSQAHGYVNPLHQELIRRGVHPASVDSLCKNCDQDHVSTMIELFDWYNKSGQTRGTGFLVNSIRNKEQVALPAGFESSTHIKARKQAEKSRAEAQREFRSRNQAESNKKELARQQAFLDVWECVPSAAQIRFENEALASAMPLKRGRYVDLKKEGGKLFEQYRLAILMDHACHLTLIQQQQWFGHQTLNLT